MERIILGLILLLTLIMTIPDGSRTIVASSSLVVVVNVLIAVFFLISFKQQHFRDVVCRYVLIWLCLIVWVSVTMIQTFQLFGFQHYDQLASVSKLSLYVTYCGFLFMMTCLLNSISRIKLVFGFLLILCVAQTLFGLLNYYSGEQPLGWRPSHWAALRVTGTYINRNFFANLLVLGAGICCIPLIVKNYKLEYTRVKDTDFVPELIVFLPSGILIIAGIILSGSRGGLLSLLISSLFSCIVIVRSKVLKLRLRYIGAVTFVVIVVFGFELLKSRFSRHLLDIGHKIDQWEATIELISQKWIVGYGPGSYEVVYKSNIPFEATPLTHNHAHSDVLELFLEQGLLGVFPVFCFMMFVYFYGVRKILISRSITRSTLMTIAIFGITGMVAHGFYDFPFQVPANVLIFMMLIGSLLACIGLRKQSLNM